MGVRECLPDPWHGIKAPNLTHAIETIRKRLPHARLVVPPTALHELALAMSRRETASIRKAAHRALLQLRAWGFEPLNLVPVGHGIAERIADVIREAELLPAEEKNDSLTA